MRMVLLSVGRWFLHAFEGFFSFFLGALEVVAF